MGGTASRIVLEHQGIEIAGQEHKWSRSPERFDVSLPYAPPVEGVSRVTLRVLPTSGKRTRPTMPSISTCLRAVGA